MTLQSYQQLSKDHKNIKYKILSHYILKLLYVPPFPLRTTKIKENSVIRTVLPHGTHYSLQSYWQVLNFWWETKHCFKQIELLGEYINEHSNLCSICIYYHLKDLFNADYKEMYIWYVLCFLRPIGSFLFSPGQAFSRTFSFTRQSL